MRVALVTGSFYDVEEAAEQPTGNVAYITEL
jgi:hypothetical protein